MEELLRCPFCGDVASKISDSGRYGPFGYVECELCGARTKTRKIISRTKFDTDEEFWDQDAFEAIVRSWNRRTEKGGEDA